MGTFWSYLVDDAEFHKHSYLSGEGDSSDALKRSFYMSFAKTVARLELAEVVEEDPTDVQVRSLLEHWPRDLDILYASTYDEDVSYSIPIQHELELESTAFQHVARQTGSQTPLQALPTTHEEAVLQGLCENPLSTSESIHQGIRNLSSRRRGDDILRIVAKYPRAFRMFIHQQLHAHADVTNGFKSAFFLGDYSRAASIVGKLAYGDESLAIREKRLHEMANLLHLSLSKPTPALSSVVANPEAALHTASARARDSFNKVMTDEAISLLDTQRKLETVLRTIGLVGGSLVETLQKLITIFPTHHEALGLAVVIANQFEVPTRQFWWILLKTMAQTAQWQLLIHLAITHRPLFGYVPIVDSLLDEDQDEYVRTLLRQVLLPEDRDEILTALANYEQNKAHV